ncbi:MAG: hypothetical protein SGPRY_007682 [Prymnesium sp.]
MSLRDTFQIWKLSSEKMRLAGVVDHTGLKERVLTVALPSLSSALLVEQRPDAPFSLHADGTHRRLWPTALVLVQYLCAHPSLVAGKRVVELGAGAGAVGLACAALGAALVVLTDMPEALPLLEDNVRRNADVPSSPSSASPPSSSSALPPPSPLSERTRVMPCTWGDASHESALLGLGGEFDVVVSCESVYKQQASVLQSLAATQRRLLHAGGVALTAYEFRGELFDDLAYFDAANALFECEPISLRPYERELADDEEEDVRFLYRYTPLPYKHS